MLGPLAICIHHQIGTFVDTVSNLQHECYELDIQAPTGVTIYCAMKPIDSTCDHTSDFSWNQHGTKLEQWKSMDIIQTKVMQMQRLQEETMEGEAM